MLGIGMGESVSLSPTHFCPFESLERCSLVLRSQARQTQQIQDELRAV
jgi:hypothetical protein